MPPVQRRPQPGQPTRPAPLPRRPQPVTRGPERGTRPVDYPRTGPGGRVITQRPLENGRGRIIAPRPEHREFMERRDYRDIRRGYENRWNRNDHDYHWERWGDRDICHRYWNGYHYYGWYMGSVFFWSMYYNDYDWWYDPYWHRWCWMHNNHWWWHENNVVYIYVDETSTYSRYDDSVGGVVTIPDTTPPVETPPDAGTTPAPAPSANQKTFSSADGTRMVAITDGDGYKGRAYLYASDDDAADQALKDGIWLGDSVSDVRFQNDSDGKLSRILTLYADDQGQQSFNLFDANGNNVSTPVVESAPADSLGDGSGVPTPAQQSLLNKSDSFKALSAGGINW